LVNQYGYLFSDLRIHRKVEGAVGSLLVKREGNPVVGKNQNNKKNW